MIFILVVWLMMADAYESENKELEAQVSSSNAMNVGIFICVYAVFGLLILYVYFKFA